MPLSIEDPWSSWIWNAKLEKIEFRVDIAKLRPGLLLQRKGPTPTEAVDLSINLPRQYCAFSR